MIMLDGAVERQIGERPAVEVEELLRTALASGRARDRAAGRTLDGPHRADLLVRHSAKDMPAELCSTGEQKALLIGLVISHARLTAEIAGSAPILLLDEVAAHLDPGRRAALFAILDDLNCQTFMTGTEASLFSSLEGRGQFLTVSHGTVAKSEINGSRPTALTSGRGPLCSGHDETPDAAAFAGGAGALCAPHRAAGDRRRRPADG